MNSAISRIVDQIMAGRRSCRAFLPTPVANEVVAEILQIAARAPSGTNTQPWKAYVLTGEVRRQLSERMLAAYDDPEEAATHSEPYAYYPKQWQSPYLERRRKIGLDLYGLLGIKKGDSQRMHEQHGRNYQFFDAPVALVFTMETVMAQGSWLDYGMFLQNVMIAAKARDLDTCPLAAPLHFHRIIRDQLQLPENELPILTMALGHADTSAIENTLKTERAPLADWVVFRG